MKYAALAFLHEANLYAHTRIKSLLIENNLAWFKAYREILEASVLGVGQSAIKEKAGDFPFGIKKNEPDRFSSLLAENQLAFYREMLEILQEWNGNLLAAITGKFPSQPSPSQELCHTPKKEKVFRCRPDCFNS